MRHTSLFGKSEYLSFHCACLALVESDTFIAVKILLGYDAVFLFRVEHMAATSKSLLRSARLDDVITQRTGTEVYRPTQILLPVYKDMSLRRMIGQHTTGYA
jgi:hypothetical protein